MALSLGLPPLGITQRPALWCPDFPPEGPEIVEGAYRAVARPAPTRHPTTRRLRYQRAEGVLYGALQNSNPLTLGGSSEQTRTLRKPGRLAAVDHYLFPNSWA